MRTKAKTANQTIISIVIGTISVIVSLILVIANLLSKSWSTMSMISVGGYVLLLLGLLFTYIVMFHRELIESKNKSLLFVTVYIIVLVLMVFMADSVPFYLIPIPIAGMLIAVLIDIKLGIIMNLVLSIIGCLIMTLNIEFALFYIISGSFSCLLITKAKQRQNMIYIALYLIGINVLTVLVYNLYYAKTLLYLDFLYAGISAVIAVIITIGSLPLWETIFDVVTPLKLLELSNSNQKLLKRLLLEAPGSYHHSQMVANLAETAAIDIGADALLTRTGALYHDIGKLRNPGYFVENQNGENPHDDIAPEASANIIINHVKDGVKIATEYRLPKSIINIIREHHGDALVQYFYYKAKQQSEGEVDEQDFRYAGPKPQSNEAAIVMLADCVEAYVRSLPEKDRTLDRIEQIVTEMIESRLDEGQLDECDLKIKELKGLKTSFIKVYKGLYHERIQYPGNTVDGDENDDH